MNRNMITMRVAVTVALALLALPAAIRAADVETWPFDLETSGEDVFYTSPTAVSNTADQYVISWEITQVIVTVQYLFITLDIDVTDQVPPENLIGTETLAGPAPVVAADDYIVYPEPPEPPAMEAHITIGLDAGGYGYVWVTEVTLGQAQVEVPPFGVVTVDLVAVRVVGTVTVEAQWYPLGDMNCDWAVNFSDVDPFVLALIGEDDYYNLYPDCKYLNADCNSDGAVNFSDVDGFVALLIGG